MTDCRLRSESEIDALHEKIVERFPDGLNYEQFKIVTLETADEDGRVYPPPLVEMNTFRMVLKMALDGLLTYRGTHHTPYVPNHFISAKGRDWIAARTDGEGGKTDGS